MSAQRSAAQRSAGAALALLLVACRTTAEPGSPPRAEERLAQLERLAAEVAARPQWRAVWELRVIDPDPEERRSARIEVALFSPDTIATRVDEAGESNWWTIDHGEFHFLRTTPDAAQYAQVDFPALIAERGDLDALIDAELPATTTTEGAAGPLLTMRLLPDPDDPEGGLFDLNLSFLNHRPHPLEWWCHPAAWHAARLEGDTLVRELFADATATLSLTSGFLLRLERPGRFECRLVELQEMADSDAFRPPPPSVTPRDISEQYAREMRRGLDALRREVIHQRSCDSVRPIAELAPALERLFARLHGARLAQELKGTVDAVAGEIDEWRSARATAPARAAEWRADLLARIDGGAAPYLRALPPLEFAVSAPDRAAALLAIERETIAALYAGTFAASLHRRLAAAECDG